MNDEEKILRRSFKFYHHSSLLYNPAERVLRRFLVPVANDKFLSESKPAERDKKMNDEEEL
jgi:hypothetical protein